MRVVLQRNRFASASLGCLRVGIVAGLLASVSAIARSDGEPSRRVERRISWNAELVLGSWANSSRELRVPNVGSADYPLSNDGTDQWREIGLHLLWGQFLLSEEESCRLLLGAFLDPEPEISTVARSVLAGRCLHERQSVRQLWRRAPPGLGRARLLDLYLDGTVSGIDSVTVLSTEVGAFRGSGQDAATWGELARMIRRVSQRATVAGEQDVLRKLLDLLSRNGMRGDWLVSMIRAARESAPAELESLSRGDNEDVVDVALSRLIDVAQRDVDALARLSALLLDEQLMPRVDGDNWSVRSRGWVVLRSLIRSSNPVALLVLERAARSSGATVVGRIVRNVHAQRTGLAVDEALSAGASLSRDELAIALGAVFRWGACDPAVLVRLAGASLDKSRAAVILRAVVDHGGRCSEEARSAFATTLPTHSILEFIGRVAAQQERRDWTPAIRDLAKSGRLQSTTAERVSAYLQWIGE